MCEVNGNGVDKILADSEVIAYYVGTNRTEGVGATHIEMSAVQSQENFNVIEAIRLNRGKKQTHNKNNLPSLKQKAIPW